MDSKTLLTELTTQTEAHKAAAEAFLTLSDEQLNTKINADSWSILECIEHLNKYGRFYNPEIEQRIQRSKHVATATYKPGWLGNYFAESMKPSEDMKKMKTFKKMNPIHSSLTRETIHEFIAQQDKLLKLIHRAQHINLTKTRTSITISKWITLRLGDTFRFYINHIARHIRQAQQVLQQQGM